VSQFIDKSEKLEKDTLPEPELNPLLNPLLAANMGRWAEVYFTSPPERRASAVAELVRQLELDSAGKPAAAEGTNANIDAGGRNETARNEARTTDAPPVPPPSPVDVSPESFNERFAVCRECRHTNPESYRFCGMCGALLRPSVGEHLIEAVPNTLLPADFALPPEPESLGHESEFSGGEKVNDDFIDKKIAPESNLDRSAEHYDSVFPPSHAEPEMGSLYIRPPLDQDDLPHFARQAEPVPYRYRIYLGLAIMIVLGAFIYMARRGDVFSGSQQSPAAKAIPEQPAAAPPEAATPPSSTPVEKVEKSETPRTPVPAPTKLQEIPQPKKAGVKPAPRPKPQPPAVPASMTARSANIGPTGSEELSEAQKYLSGNYGARNGEEAAQWLWKAVAKGNGSAALTLSDLYLHGSGIAQNCDQARLLLDVAAKKGVKGAAERLRNMQAFGCR